MILVVGIVAVLAVSMVAFLVVEDELDRRRHERLMRHYKPDLTNRVIYRRRRP